MKEWETFGEYNTVFRRKGSKEAIGEVWLAGDRVQSQADAKRLVYCVNALRGFTDEQLYSAAEYARVYEEKVAKLQDKVDELQKELSKYKVQSIVKDFNNKSSKYIHLSSALDKLNEI